MALRGERCQEHLQRVQATVCATVDAFAEYSEPARWAASFKQYEYGNIILPFTVMRRLDVMLEPTKQQLLDAVSKTPPDALRNTMLKRAVGVGFYNTSEFTMGGLLDDADGIRENLTQYVTSFSPEIADIFDKFRIFDVIKRLDDKPATSVRL